MISSGGALIPAAGVPVVKPAAPELAAHEGAILLEILQRQDLGHVGAEVGYGQKLGQSAAAEHPTAGAVRGEEGAVDAVFAVDVHHLAEVGLVVAVAAVLVLHLHHDDTAAVGAEVGTDTAEELGVVGAHLIQVQGIVTAQGDMGVLEQPGGQAAEFPLGADVRTGTEDDVEPQLLGGLDEAGNVQHIREIEDALFSLVEVPAAVGLHGVKAAGLQLGEAIRPVLGAGAVVVDGARNDGVGLAVQEKLPVVVGKFFGHDDSLL